MPLSSLAVDVVRRAVAVNAHDSEYLDRWKGELGVGDLLEELRHG